MPGVGDTRNINFCSTNPGFSKIFLTPFVGHLAAISLLAIAAASFQKANPNNQPGKGVFDLLPTRRYHFHCDGD
jgi:hypothetical protein